jgi:hypothetical protein
MEKQIYGEVITTYTSQSALTKDAYVDNAAHERLVVKCSLPDAPSTDKELYNHLLKHVVSNLRGNPKAVYAFGIVSNIPMLCQTLHLSILVDPHPEFVFDDEHMDPFLKSLATQLGVSGDGGEYDPAHVCTDCMVRWTGEELHHEFANQKTIH